MTPDHSGAMVVDASVAIAICIEEPGFEWALRILRQRSADGSKILVPAFFWLEILNVLITRYRQPPGPAESWAAARCRSLPAAAPHAGGPSGQRLGF